MRFVDVVFDGPPSHESGRFVECEDENGAGVNAGEWIDRGNGLWVLRIQLERDPSKIAKLIEAARDALTELRIIMDAAQAGHHTVGYETAPRIDRLRAALEAVKP